MQVPWYDPPFQCRNCLDYSYCKLECLLPTDNNNNNVPAMPLAPSRWPMLVLIEPM